MKQKAAVLNLHENLVLAFAAAAIVFALSYNADAYSVLTAKKSSAVKKADKNKQSAKSVMFLKTGKHVLIAQNSTSATKINAKSKAALDAKLEGEIVDDSQPIVATAKLAKKIEKKTESVHKFGAAFTLDTATGVNDAGNRAFSGGYILSPSYTNSAMGISVKADLEYDREYTYELDDGHDGDWASPIVKARKEVKVGGIIDSVSFGPNLSIGMGREVRRQTFRGSLGFSAGVLEKLGKLAISQSLGYTYRLYNYDIRNDGTVNSPDLYSAGLGAQFEILKNLTVGADFILQHAISFQKVGRSSTSTSLAAEYAVSDHASIALGVATLKRGTLQADGQMNRVKLYDPEIAQWFLDLNLSI